ncbi:MAG: enoyl-CoA hydratase/isomerase family protein [Myxococcales bacterium]|nr:enoyl-CoA hydratase/isomerase family protein [Myxococcales bacterium]MCB9750669.1 enoyl-CoA hydratase/isomerase family protein [Myxococcales bacterium]
MSQVERVVVTVEDGVADVHMRDEAGKNAFSRAFVDALVAALTAVSRDERVKVCVLRGLPEVFSAGGDRALLLELAEGRIAPYDLLLTRTLLEVPVPTIAAMAGAAVGGGLIFGLSCDVVILARESRYGVNFMDLGFTPGMGTTRLLQRAVGEYVAAEMMYGCQYFRGKHFIGRAQVNHIEPRAVVEDRARQIAWRMADKPRGALTLLKRSLSLSRRQAFEEARTIESMMHEVCFGDPETRARIRENYNSTGDSSASQKSEDR